MNSLYKPWALPVLRVLAAVGSLSFLAMASATLSANDAPTKPVVAAEDGDAPPFLNIVLDIQGIMFVRDSYVNVWLNSEKDKPWSRRLGKADGIFKNCHDKYDLCGKARMKIRAVKPGVDYKLTVCHTTRKGTDCALTRQGRTTEAGEVRTIRPSKTTLQFTVDLRDSYP